MQTLTQAIFGRTLQDTNQNIGWADAWIEIVETIGPLYPIPPEM